MSERRPMKRLDGLVRWTLIAMASCTTVSSQAPPVDAVASFDGDEVDAVREPMDAPDVAVRMDAGMDAARGIDAALDASAPRDLGGPDAVGDVATVDRPDVVLPEIPTDPAGLAAPGSECGGDAGVREGDPTIAAPRPILPQSVSRVTSQRPTFRWALPEGTTGARVEVCADRCCTRVLQTLEAEGTSVRPTTALPPGMAYWRMFGRRAGATGSRASATWEFEVRRRDTPVDSSWGTIRDFTGDGFDDLLLSSGARNADGTLNFYVVEGGSSGPRAPRIFGRVDDLPRYQYIIVGDFNGDGRADLTYTWQSQSERRDFRLDVLQSRPIGAPSVMQLNVADIRGADLNGAAVTDWNGDGYSDLLTSAYFFNAARSDIVGSVLLVYLGSPAGLSRLPQQVERLDGLVARPWVGVRSEVGDVDSDGYGDIVVSDLVYGRSGQGRTILHGQGVGPVRASTAFALSDPRDEALVLRPAGDQDGDGVGEVICKTDTSPPLYTYRGASGLAGPAEPVREPAGSVGGRDFGNGLGAADLNGDGFADLLVGSPFTAADVMDDRVTPFNGGRLYVYFGSPAGLLRNPIWFARVRPTDPADLPLGFAERVAAPGDLNGDGIDDAAALDFERGTACFIAGTRELVGERLGDCITVPGGLPIPY
jgi:hypothetical protein